MDMRQLKALEIAARMRLVWEDGAWSVPSSSGQGKYRVVLKPEGNTCTCPDFELTGKDCKHVLAASFVCERDYGGKTLLIDTDVLPAKKTYSQDWPKYNEAQTSEKRRFQELLFDLCQGIEEPSQPKTGRRRTLMKDMIFATTFKVYCTFSARRFACDLADAHGKGYLTSLMHSVHIGAFFNSAMLTPVLQSLIVQSSLPLRSIETTFAPDSSGFSTSRFVKWFDHKYGATRQEHAWVKVHIMTGVKTNIVTAVEIKGPDAGDSPQFIPLVQTTGKNFTIKEVPADKAYGSLENLEAVAALGGTAYIPYKTNATGAKGGLWEKMFHYYNFHREDFLKHYHQRSNVESTFSMVKAKFRDHVRSKNDTAMMNEVLCKFLAHNLCVVHQSHIELGIEPVFWPAPAEKTEDVLPLAQPG